MKCQSLSQWATVSLWEMCSHVFGGRADDLLAGGAHIWRGWCLLRIQRAPWCPEGVALSCCLNLPPAQDLFLRAPQSFLSRSQLLITARMMACCTILRFQGELNPHPHVFVLGSNNENLLSISLSQQRMTQVWLLCCHKYPSGVWGSWWLLNQEIRHGVWFLPSTKSLMSFDDFSVWNPRFPSQIFTLFPTPTTMCDRLYGFDGRGILTIEVTNIRELHVNIERSEFPITSLEHDGRGYRVQMRRKVFYLIFQMLLVWQKKNKRILLLEIKPRHIKITAAFLKVVRLDLAAVILKWWDVDQRRWSDLVNVWRTDEEMTLRVSPLCGVLILSVWRRCSSTWTWLSVASALNVRDENLNITMKHYMMYLWW